ncbi:MAG: hypothetical protein AAF502_20280 [Bacteroidota bacterium]
MNQTRRKMLALSGAGLLGLLGGICFPQQVLADPNEEFDKIDASDIRFFRDEFSTEFRVPGEVRVGETFNINLKVGNYKKQVIRKLYFLSDWGYNSQFFPANHEGRNMQVEIVEHPEPFTWHYNTSGGSHQRQKHKWIMKHPETGANVNLKGENQIQLRIGQRGRLLLCVFYKTLMASQERTFPHYFIINIS